ncbi:hypothetical protein F5146DRAFT_74956 [Armillaria mellea]|nr:hypothetical protein F5146DRAFT_74956 [Armillaria mellea]
MPSVSKINQFPDELLALIFATGLCGLTPDQHQPLLALICSVCRHWRDVAIEASELWTTIHISLERYLPAVQAFLERSKGRPIDLDISALHSGILAHKVAEITAPHISRTRTLIVHLPDFNIYNVFLKAYRSIFATNLCSLSIHVIVVPSPRGHSPLFAGTDSLTYLDTDGYFLEVLPSKISLTTLKLDNYSPTLLDLQNLFDASPCLETLVLRDLDIDETLDRVNEGDDSVPITITAPTTLKSLAVSGLFPYGIGTDLSGCVLDKLCIPDLEYLEVVGSIINDIHFRELAKLQTLRVQHCTVSSANAEFFLSLKELRRLELVVMWSEDIRHVVEASLETLPSSSSPSFLHLSSVFFSTELEYVVSPYQLLQLADHCVAVGCPRFTIEVEQGRSEEFFSAVESCTQDGRVCVRESDCSSGLM